MAEPNPERVAAIADRAARLGKLKNHPSWNDLREVFEARRRKIFDALVRQHISGVEIDQRYIDRVAGFFKGAEWILDNPEMAEKSLEAALKRAELLQPYKE